MAGEIMPSVITSTTCIAALLSLQLYAFCQKNNYKYLRVGMIDLSDNTINLATPSLIQINLLIYNYIEFNPVRFLLIKSKCSNNIIII